MLRRGFTDYSYRCRYRYEGGRKGQREEGTEGEGGTRGGEREGEGQITFFYNSYLQCPFIGVHIFIFHKQASCARVFQKWQEFL